MSQTENILNPTNKYDEIFDAVLSDNAESKDSHLEIKEMDANPKVKLTNSTTLPKVKNGIRKRCNGATENAANAKKRVKKFRETTKDRLLEWNSFYSNTDFGVWIECTKCHKWRHSKEYSEDHEVPEDWICSNTQSDDGKELTCDDPEENMENIEFSPVRYIPGTIVWAKLAGFPWWPAMVEDDPDTEEYYWLENKTVYYHATFLDEHVSRAWVSECNIRPFKKTPFEKWQRRYTNLKYPVLIKKAEEKAKTAMQMTIKERLENFSFAHQYKGTWPLADKSEDEDIKITEMLIREIDELESVNSFDSDENAVTETEKMGKTNNQRNYSTKNIPYEKESEFKKQKDLENMQSDSEYTFDSDYVPPEIHNNTAKSQKVQKFIHNIKNHNENTPSMGTKINPKPLGKNLKLKTGKNMNKNIYHTPNNTEKNNTKRKILKNAVNSTDSFENKNIKEINFKTMKGADKDSKLKPTFKAIKHLSDSNVLTTEEKKYKTNMTTITENTTHSKQSTGHSNENPIQNHKKVTYKQKKEKNNSVDTKAKSVSNEAQLKLKEIKNTEQDMENISKLPENVINDNGCNAIVENKTENNISKKLKLHEKLQKNSIQLKMSIKENSEENSLSKQECISTAKKNTTKDQIKSEENVKLLPKMTKEKSTRNGLKHKKIQEINNFQQKVALKKHDENSSSGINKNEKNKQKISTNDTLGNTEDTKNVRENHKTEELKKESFTNTSSLNGMVANGFKPPQQMKKNETKIKPPILKTKRFGMTQQSVGSVIESIKSTDVLKKDLIQDCIRDQETENINEDMQKKYKIDIIDLEKTDEIRETENCFSLNLDENNEIHIDDDSDPFEE
ncbi:myb-like protein X [Stegodyphus dumicola]|uniref:myb-like protein X n=1 Tax=Stegodyphus dumicola TaxID=202533 RepID=UPI0015A8AE7D|nr:myb-like protein X [Stegodyphus dumicola]XP_035215142.1 myb-like protein X [Stegodyphus dumicola]